MADRAMRFDRQMSDAEALMWNVENDPQLSSNIGTVTVLDRPCDFELFRRRIAAAVADIPRMRERVAPVLGRLAPPVWEPDAAFDLDYHLRRISLPGPGSERQLFDLAAIVLQEPLDRTRPLWSFVVIDGLSDGRGALFTKMHHAITDGEGGVRLAEKYMDVERDAPPPPDVDLGELLQREGRERDGAPGGLGPAAAQAVGHGLRRTIGIARRTIGELALAAADPPRLVEGARSLTRGLGAARDQVSGGASGSPVWRARSRRRWYDVLDVPFEPSRTAAKLLGGSLNDLFVTGAVNAAVSYHDAVDAEADSFNVTFVVSTRDDSSAGGNAFTPSKVRVPAGKMDVRDRFDAVKDVMTRRRSDVGGGVDMMRAVSGVANLLPTSVVTRVGRDQAAAIDFATSNVRAAPFDLYIAGAKVLAPYPMGPVAGTAWNITMMSYASSLFMGVHVDPVAVAEPDLLMRSLRDAFTELLEVSR